MAESEGSHETLVPDGETATAHVGSTESIGNTGQEEQWKTQAIESQRLFLLMFGSQTYFSYKTCLPSICNLLLTTYCKCFESDEPCKNESELQILKRNIGFALYGPPQSRPADDNNFYSDIKKTSIIEKIFNQIVQEQKNGEVLMAPLYVTLEGKNEDGGIFAHPVPVFRIPNGDRGSENLDEHWFVDHLGRRYKSWEDFLTSNKFASSRICYPKNGIYTVDSNGNVEVCFGLTPASSLSDFILTSADRASPYVGLSAGALGIGATVVPFLAPAAIPCVVVGGTVGIYNALRSSLELADQGRHGESLADRDSVRHWISIAGSFLGVGSSVGMASIQLMAQQGRNVSVLVTGIVTGLNFSSLAVNGISIAENFWTIFERGELDPLQLLQFTSSILFFSFSVINTKTARSVYNETQNQILEDHRSGLRSNRHRKLFDGMERETLRGEQDPIAARAKIIRDINHISNKDEFYARVLRSNKVSRRNSQTSKKLKFGELHDQRTEKTNVNNLVALEGGMHVSPSLVSGNVESTVFSRVPKFYKFRQEPGLFPAIKGVLASQNFRSNMQHLLPILDDVCRKFKYGKYFMRALRVVLDCFNCQNSQNLIYIIQEVLNISWDMWQERCREEERLLNAEDMSSERASENERQANGNVSFGTHSSEEIMDEVVNDMTFIPQLIFGVEAEKGLKMKEEVYHFPTDHRSWGEKGELTPDEYILIGQNIFGIANVQCANIFHEESTANVYFENVGFATITSYVKEQKIVIKKINFCDPLVNVSLAH